MEFARTIHGAGTDLLNLISDILDLSKIESGTVSVEAEEVFFRNLLEMVARPFRHEAENRRLAFEVQTDPQLTRSLVTDSKRLQQVLKNLLSNAFKFTEHGSVRLAVSVATKGWSEDHPILSGAASVVAFRSHRFRNRNCSRISSASSSRPSSRQMPAPAANTAERAWVSPSAVNLQAFWVARFSSAARPVKAARSHLYLPLTYVGPSASKLATSDWSSIARPRRLQLSNIVVSELPVERIADDRDNLQPDDAVLLIVEDDPHYARVLCDLSRDKGFKVLVALRGAEALALAREFHPTAVSLDVFLPDMLGWTVLNHLKQDPATRHIPVQMLTLDEDRHHGLARGAFAFVTKPTSPEDLESALGRIKEYASPRRKRLLIVEDNPAEQMSIRELLGYDDIDVFVVCHRRGSSRPGDARNVRLRRAGLAITRHDGLRHPRAHARYPCGERSCPSLYLREKNCLRRRTRDCTRWPAAWS